MLEIVVFGVVAGLLGWRAALDRRRERALVLRAEIQAALNRALRCTGARRAGSSRGWPAPGAGGSLASRSSRWTSSPPRPSARGAWSS